MSIDLLLIITEITCESPFTPKHAQVSIRKLGSKATALFECDEGYQLEPNIPTIFCTEKGTWNEVMNSSLNLPGV